MDYKIGDCVNFGLPEDPVYATIESVTEQRILVSWDEGTGVVLLPRRLMEMLAVEADA